jgi:biotin carboxyl carrier protein
MRIALRYKHEHLLVEIDAAGGNSRVQIGDEQHVVELCATGDGRQRLVVDGRSYCVDVCRVEGITTVAVAGEVYSFHADTGPSAHTVTNVATPEITSPMPGKILQVPVQPGDRVEAGDTLLTLEAMKMESRLVAEASGTIAEVRVAPGDLVDGGKVLMVLAYDSPSD